MKSLGQRPSGKKLLKKTKKGSFVLILYCPDCRRRVVDDGTWCVRGSHLWHHWVQWILADDIKTAKVWHDWGIVKRCLQV